MILIENIINEISMGPFGSDIKVDNFVSEGIPVLNGSNISGVRLLESFSNFVTNKKAESLKKANAKRGDIVVTHRGTLGQIAYIPENSSLDKYVISQSQFRVSLDRKLVDPAYFTYYFHTQEGQKRLLSFKSHVGVPALAQATTNFRKLEFPLIPLSEQLKIVKVLSDLDSKIELNNKISRELEAMAKLIYDYWFVQFDFPDANGQPYKSSGGLMIYNDELKREIPKHWQWEKIDKLIDVKDGTHESPKPANKGHFLITSKHLKRTGIDFSNAYLISNKDFISVNKRSMVEKGDFLLSMIGTIGLSYWVIDMDTKFAIKNIGLFKTSQSPKWADYVYSSVNSLLGKAFLKQNSSTGTSQPYVTLGTLRSIPIVLPPTDILELFNHQIRPIHKAINNKLLENQKLINLRDWLLPMLMNGQIKVK